MNVVLNEWEGPTVNGIQWVPMTNQHQIQDFFMNGARNRTNKTNEFGRLSDKATCIFSLEVTQVTESSSGFGGGSGDTNVLVSRLHVVDLPGCEILNEDPEALRVKQGSTLNRGIQAVNTLMRDLSTNQHGDNVFYEGSTITQLMRDTLGGNSLTLGLFTLQYGDPIGSTLTLRALKRCQQIMNFPVINDNRTIGLLRKYRLEMNASHGVLPRAINPGAAGFSDSLDTYNLKIAELEKKLIEENLEKLRFTDDKQKLVTRMQEMKSKFNELVQSKAELQAELITSEEEKLKVSKALIELQIENTRMQEMVQNGQFDTSAKLLHAENDMLELNLREERAAKAIQELQDKLREALDDKKELEIEFVALKKNYLNIQQDLDQEKLRSDTIGVELVNLVNENKALMSSTDKAKAGDIDKSHSLLNQLQEAKEALLEAKGEIQKLKSELLKMEVEGQKSAKDYEAKRLEFQNELMQMSQKGQTIEKQMLEKQTSAIRSSMFKNPDDGQWEIEKAEMHKKIRDLSRKVEELTDDVKMTEEANLDLKSEKSRLQL